MAAGSLLALLDDIASVLDDVALLTRMASQKTAGVLGDDLALNAQQVAGVKADRELPVVWAVARGSALNKAILVPTALAIAAFAPWAITPLLMVGGAYLCFEGFEKIAHRFLHSHEEDDAEHTRLVQAVADPVVDLVAFERTKIRGAIRTDFILSAEIIAITLGTVAAASLGTQLMVLSAVAAIMTVGVYGLVAGIVKLDDIGLHLSRLPGAGWSGAAWRRLGRGLLLAAPWLMKGLSIAGTAAMFLVGGGILTHGLPWLHHAIESLTASVATVLGGSGELLASLLADALTGLIAGGLVLAGVNGARAVFRMVRGPRAPAGAP